MAGMISVTTSSPNDDDSEWEYEYDGDETEDYFVTLDLTTHSTPTSLAALRENPTIKRSKLGTPAVVANPAGTQDGSDRETCPPPQIQPTKDDIQFLGLHTTTPVVAYKGRSYSCTWTMQVGTNIFVSDKGSTDAKSEGKAIGTSSMRLIAKPVELVRKDDTNHKEAGMSRDLASPQPDPPVPSTLEDGAQSAGRPSFLDRFTSLKAMKGQLDRPIQIHAGQYRIPEEQKVVKKRKRSSNGQMAPSPGSTPAPRSIQPSSAPLGASSKLARQSTEPRQFVDDRRTPYISLPKDQRPARGRGSRGGRVRAINNPRGAFSHCIGTVLPEDSAAIQTAGAKSQSNDASGASTPSNTGSEQHSAVGTGNLPQETQESSSRRNSTLERSRYQAPRVGQPPNEKYNFLMPLPTNTPKHQPQPRDMQGT